MLRERGPLHKKMALSVDQIIAKFLHKYLLMINGEPYNKSIHNICILLYGNASTLTTILGGGNHGHISIFVQDTLYRTI